MPLLTDHIVPKVDELIMSSDDEVINFVAH